MTANEQQHKGIQMSLNKQQKINLSIVAGETFVDPCVLLENEDFCTLLINGASVEKLITFVNQNF